MLGTSRQVSLADLGRAMSAFADVDSQARHLETAECDPKSQREFPAGEVAEH
jgi:hypothetical protein